MANNHRATVTAIAILIVTTGIVGCVSTQRAPAVSAPFPEVATTNIFANYEPLEFELDAELAMIFNYPPGGMVDKSRKIAGKLNYTDAQGKAFSLPVAINVKGFASTTFCTFPKIEFKFTDPQALAGTYFTDTTTIDLNTHCIESDDTKNPHFQGLYFAHREALIYRFAEILKIPTL